MARLTLIAILAACAALVQASAVRADEAQTVKLTAVVEMEVEVVNPEGELEIQRVPAGKVIPGDEVIYTIHYSNVGSEQADNIVITNPLPEHTRYSVDSAEGTRSVIEYSIDGGVNYGDPKKLTVREPDGTERVARPSEYTHIRWKLLDPVAPGQAGEVSFRVVLV